MKIKTNAMKSGQFVFVITLSMYAIVLTTLLTMNVSGPVLERFSETKQTIRILSSTLEREKRKIVK